MSPDLTTAIDAFEGTYLVRLQNWAAMLPEDDLDQIIQNLEDIKQTSEAITARFTALDQHLYQSRWLPILNRVRSMLPGLMRQLNAINARARLKTNNLDRGQVGLKGYRQTLPPTQRIKFDSEG